jgi:hypothetical protein
MPTRPLIFALLAALAMTPAAWLVRADEVKAAKTGPDAKPAEPPKQAAPPRPDGPSKDDKRKDDGEKRPPRGERGDWGQRGDMPPREWGPGGPIPGGRQPGRFDQFSPDELREMIAAVEPKNKKLADKMKDRLADAIAKKPTTLTQEQIDAALAVFEDREPHLAAGLKKYLTENPERVTAILAAQWPRIQAMIDLKRSDRQLYDAQTVEIQKLGDSRGISWKLRKAIDSKNEAEVTLLKSQLRDKLVEQHKARQEIRRLELVRLTDKVTKLSEEITAEESKSAEQIEKHFQFLLKWAESPAPRRGERPEKGDKPDKNDRPDKKEKPE